MKITPIIGNSFPEIVIPELNSADISIKIIIFDWRWYTQNAATPINQFNAAIIAAKDRGCNVQVLTNASNVRQVLCNFGIDAKGIFSGQLLHAKLIIIDEKSIIIGSHNYSQSAMSSNIEASVLISDCDCASDYVDFFNLLFANGDR